jgi:heat shock protein HslJ
MKKIFILLSMSLALSSYAYAEDMLVTTSVNTSQAIQVPEKNLVLGQRGSDVKSLQDVLVSHGYLSNNDSTGYFGIKTRAALIKLQKENGIPTIGKFGPATRAFLKNKIIEIKPIGGEKDSHGCLIAAGYSWDTSTQSCVRPWEQATTTRPIGGSTDSHGCLIAAGYSWDSAVNACNRPWEKLSSLLSRDWVVKTIDGQNYTNLSFKVVDGSVSARACNSIFGKIKIDDVSNTISAPMLASTLMACDANLMNQDTIFSQTLADTAKVTFDLNANPITMTIVGGNHILVFTLK